MGLHMRNHTDFEALGTNAAVGLRAPPLALWVLLRHQNEGPCCLRCRLRPWQWVTPACAAGCHFLSRKVTAGLANMEERAAWTRECACTQIKRVSKAGQLTQIAYVEDEAVEPMARVSMCEEPTRCHAKDDYPRSHIDTLDVRAIFLRSHKKACHQQKR